MEIEFGYNPQRQHPWAWYYSPQGKEFSEVMLWCYYTYGDPIGTDRWNNHGGWIRFRDEQDAMLFKLKWS